MALNRTFDNIDPSTIGLPEYTNSDAPPDTLFFNSSEGIVYKDASGDIHGSGSGGGGVGGYASQTADGSTTEFRIAPEGVTGPTAISIEAATDAASTDPTVGWDSSTNEIVITYAAAPADGETVGWYWMATGGDGSSSGGGGANTIRLSEYTSDRDGNTPVDSVFDSAVSAANPDDTIVFDHGTYLLEGYHTIQKPLTITAVDATLRMTATASDGSEAPQIKFVGGGLRSASGGGSQSAGLSSAVGAGVRTIPVSDTTIFSAGDAVLLLNGQYAETLDARHQFARIESVDGTNGTITIYGSTRWGFDNSSNGGAVYPVDLLDGPVFDGVDTEGGGDQPFEFRWCANAVYRECAVSEFKQVPLYAHDCWNVRWEACRASDPVSRGSGEGEVICAYRVTDAYVRAPRLHDVRRGVDIAWGTNNLHVEDPVIEGYSIGGITVHQSNVAGPITVLGGRLVADPNGVTGNGIVGSPACESMHIQGTSITTRRDAILCPNPTSIEGVRIDAASGTSTPRGLSITNGQVSADVIIDDPAGDLAQPIHIEPSGRAIRGVDIDADITYPGENAVYIETPNSGQPIESVDINATIQASDGTTPGQNVMVFAGSAPIRDVTLSVDVYDTENQAVRLNTASGATMDNITLADSHIQCGAAAVYDSGSGSYGTLRVRDCDLDTGTTSVVLDGDIEKAFVTNNSVTGTVDASGASNREVIGTL